MAIKILNASDLYLIELSISFIFGYYKSAPIENALERNVHIKSSCAGLLRVLNHWVFL